ncbi:MULTISPECIES: acyl carrier protein [Streptomyces]|uniref:Acyl carrier protein n=1 Tax=Streptomyces odorifer TaxID=53450 RepID=A0A7Y6EZP3_9ACTN|nr:MULTISPECIES: acyl carrier protein [Streptomyces]NUV36584.1 acyl carrier protein [Streptomyces sp. KAI-27]NUV45453.1 acyl carrier protein [Streptomyces sp. CAI-78]MBL0777512.1 acyl carrier protein [Streptomyces albidoflavus]MBL0800061.1 acyl carrier protein [Streptomyces albidoflavus]MBV1953207.1 acyl carrier protein [Streptomyces sp. BV333]
MENRKTQQEIEDDLRGVIAEIFPGQLVELDSSTPLFNGGLSLNSTQMIELTLAFETFYDIELEPELLTTENFATLGSLATLLEELLEDEVSPV